MRRTLSGAVALAIVGATPVIAVATPAYADAGPALAVDVGADRHPISPDIYGMNFADEALAAELALPVRRWGGNATTRYHFRYDTTNRASDWFFENISEDNPNPEKLPDGSSSDETVEQDRRTGSSTILTLPLIGWAPKARDGSCGFSVVKYGPQEQTDVWRPDCGNGRRPDGTLVTGNDPHDTSVEIGPEYVRDWVRHLVGRYGTAATGGVKYYSFDNEPDIWHSTHRDVHPTGASSVELRDQAYAIGAALKSVDPTASTLGPVGWGWTSWDYSGLDQETCGRTNCWADPPDRAARGGLNFTTWYLQQMRAYEQAHGQRILDYFDMHYYPQGGQTWTGGGDPTMDALRLRSTRALWDPTYVDESWINTPVQLVPRMKASVAANYPGTRTAVTEYNWGALDHINGALTQADILGIFGREGLDLATLWAPPSAGQPGAYAFRMYRNYDGAGGRFGDVAVRGTSADQGKLAIYPADRRSDGALTMMVVNKSGTSLSSNVSLFGRYSPVAQVYRYSDANLGAIQHLADQPVSRAPVHPGTPDGVFTHTFPANSVTLFVLPAQYRATAAHRNLDAQPRDGELRPGLLVTNAGTSALPLAQVTVRYWFTRERGARTFRVTCERAQVGCRNLTQRVVLLPAARPGADAYLEVGFTSGAGVLAPGAVAGDVAVRVCKTDGSAFVEPDDWSYAPPAPRYAPNPHVTVYLNGTLVAGTEP